MIKLRIKEILRERGLTNYWLYKQLGMSYQNFSRMINNETQSIKYTNLEAVCDILNCKPSDLFEYCPDKQGKA